MARTKRIPGRPIAADPGHGRLLRCIGLGGDIGYRTALLSFFETGLIGPLLLAVLR
jgi:hypothetical protein